MTFLPPEIIKRLGEVLRAGTDDFAELARIGGLDPAASFRFADLRHVKFKTDNLAGFDFSGADLRGTDIAECDLTGATWSVETIWPDGFTPPEREEQTP